MTTWSPRQIGDIWARNGGAILHVQVAVAVALAESGGNDHAVSPSDDYGLWQINAINLPTFGLSRSDALNPDVSARVAIAMSGNGTNWAAWCTCWLNPGRDCGHGFLPSPQIGSPAWRALQSLDATLGGQVGGGVGAGIASNTEQVGHAWAQFTSFVGPWGRSRWAGLKHTADLAKRIK